MELRYKKVLVTGAGGFIGSHLTERLVKESAKVRALVNYNSRNDFGKIEEIPIDIKKQIEIVDRDFRDSNLVMKITRDIDIIFHLGARISVPHSYDTPRDHIQTNILGTLNFLESALEHGTEKIITTSTSETYGTALYTPIDENHPLQAQSPYAASKAGADILAKSFYCSFKLPLVIVRPFNTYGPRQSDIAVIPTIISQAIMGEKINIGSLEPKRDFTYVTDIVDAFIKTAECNNSIGEIINIGSGSTFSIKDIVKITSKILGKDLESKIEVKKERKRPENSEVLLLLCDNSKAKKLLGWQPKISLEDGLKNVVEYIQANLDKYHTNKYNI